VFGVLLAAALFASTGGAAERSKFVHLTAKDEALIVDSQGDWHGVICWGKYVSKTQTPIECYLSHGKGYVASSYAVRIDASGVSVVRWNKDGQGRVVFARKHSTRATSAASRTRSTRLQHGALESTRQVKELQLRPGDSFDFNWPSVRTILCQNHGAKGTLETTQCSISIKAHVKADTYVVLLNSASAEVFRLQDGKFVKAFKRLQPK
jgi:hypothetical protein